MAKEPKLRTLVWACDVNLAPHVPVFLSKNREALQIVYWMQALGNSFFIVTSHTARTFQDAIEGRFDRLQPVNPRHVKFLVHEHDAKFASGRLDDDEWAMLNEQQEDADGDDELEA